MSDFQIGLLSNIGMISFVALSAYLLNVTILYSSSRRHAAKAACDVYFNPPLERVGLLAWQRFDAIVEQGRAHAEEVLAQPAVQDLLHP